MAHIKDLIVNGNSRTVGTAYATKFEGPLTGNATSATKATQDGNGNTITSTYATASSLSSHTGNKSNPHSVTKAQVGLGSVANYDQSKAIKSITRSGTTFTATALDGSTITFTQQDTNTTYVKASSSSDGLMSAADKAKLDGVASGANKYAHPGYTAHANGLYKVTVDGQGHVSAATAVTKADITALGIPGQDTNTTYTLAGLGGVAKSGDTMSGNLNFSAIGDTGKSAGLAWSGSTDGASIYYQTTAKDQGNLVLNMVDDPDTNIRFDWSGVNKAYISSDGVYHGTATYANSAGSANTATTASTANAVAWANVSGKPSTYAPSSHTHGLVADSHAKTLPAQSKDLTWATNIASNSGFWLYSLRLQNIAPEWAVGGGYGAGIAFGGEDTKGVITLEYHSPTIRVAGGNGTAPVWHVDLVHSENIGSQSVRYATTAGSANSVAWANISGKPSTYYTHPGYTAHASGLYKVTVDGQGHVSGATAVTKSDITALGIPGQDTNTTYNDATTSAHGLMTAAMVSKLNGIASGANAYVHPSYTAHGNGLYKVTVDGTGHVSVATTVTSADIRSLGIAGLTGESTLPSSYTGGDVWKAPS